MQQNSKVNNYFQQFVMNTKLSLQKNNTINNKFIQESVNIRISNVNKQLTKLSDIFSNNQQFNKMYIKKILQKKQSSSSSNSSISQNNQLLDSIHQNFKLQNLNVSNSQSIFLQAFELNHKNSEQNSNNKHPDEQTSSALKLQSEIIDSQITISKKQKNIIKTQHIQKNSSFSKKIDNQNILPNKVNLSRPKSMKNIKKINSKNIEPKFSKNKTQIKQFNKLFEKYPLDKKKNSKPILSKAQSIQYKKNFQQFNKKQGQKIIEPKSKLNKINLNKYKQNLKKNHDLQNLSQGLDQKLHLNLKQILPLMQRLIQKKNISVEYQYQTQKYQKQFKQMKQKLLITQINQLTNQKSDLCRLFGLIANFAAQFSEKLNKKLISIQIQKFQFKYQSLVKDTIKILSKIPKKLFKNNVISQVRYQQFMKQSQKILKGIQTKYKQKRLYIVIIKLKNYLQFLFNNKLIQMTQRKNLYTRRKIIQYYSHRSQRDIKIRKKQSNDQQTKDKKHKNNKKQYDSQRKFYLSQQNKGLPQPEDIAKFKNIIKKKLIIPNKNEVKNEKFIQLSTRSGKMKKYNQLKKNKSNNLKLNLFDLIKK